MEGWEEGPLLHTPEETEFGDKSRDKSVRARNFDKDRNRTGAQELGRNLRKKELAEQLVPYVQGATSLAPQGHVQVRSIQYKGHMSKLDWSQEVRRDRRGL